MLSDEIADKLVERIVNRIEQGNTYILEQIGKSIKKIGSVSPSKAQQLAQIIRYGGDYDKIVRKLAKITELNIKDIEKIFREVAKINQEFSKQFFKYRKIKYIPWEENEILQRQVNALANLSIKDYINLTNTKALGFSVQQLDENGKLKTVFKDLSTAYVDTLDQAVLSVSQGKTTFDEEMRRIMKQLGESGIKTINYADDRNIRLDSAIRMNLKAGLSNLQHEVQQKIGEQFDFDGWEITVHEYPAEDHALAQGRQFSIEQYEQLQTTGYATDYTGLEIDLHKYNKNGEQQTTFRPIRSYNCYHWENAIVLGVSKPRYSNDELQKIMDRNETGFDFEGKHYSMYEGTQLQRQIELEVRKQKDMQIMARAGDNEQLAMESQTKINQLTRKYKELNETSGLKSKMERLSVSGYHKIKASNDIVENTKLIQKWNKKLGEKYGSFDILNGNVPYDEKKQNWVNISEDLKDLDNRVLSSNFEQIDKLYNKYKLQADGLIIAKDTKKIDSKKAIAYTIGGNQIYLSDKMKNAEKLKEKIQQGVNTNNYTNKIKENTELIYPITHEVGHIIENRLIEDKHNLSREIIDNLIKQEIMVNVIARTGLNEKEIMKKYFSGYAKSKKNFEWFAESFAQLELGYKNEWIEEFEKWLKKEIF